MRIDRRDFLKVGALAAAGLATIPDKFLAEPTHMKITTYWGQMFFNMIKYHGLPKCYSSADSFEEKLYPQGYKPEYKIVKEETDAIDIETQGMEYLMSTPRITNQAKRDVRDGEVAERVIDEGQLVEVLKHRYPPYWQDMDVRMDLFNYLVTEIEKLNTDGEDFSEDYAQFLVKSLLKEIPNERFDFRVNLYNTKRHSTPKQLGGAGISEHSSENRFGKLCRNPNLPLRLCGEILN